MEGIDEGHDEGFPEGAEVGKKLIGPIETFGSTVTAKVG